MSGYMAGISENEGETIVCSYPKQNILVGS